MAQKYTKKPKTGHEYVDATKEFVRYTNERLLKMPAKWQDYLLNPVHNAAEEIRKCVLRANKVYISDKMEPEDLLEAYKKREEYLYQAIREFTVFDDAFEELMLQIDFLHDETKRMKNILKHLIEEAEQAHTEDGIMRLDIKARMRLDEVEYTSVVGAKRMKLGLTQQNKDYWLSLEQDALDEIKARIRDDNHIVKNIKKKTEQEKETRKE